MVSVLALSMLGWGLSCSYCKVDYSTCSGAHTSGEVLGANCELWWCGCGLHCIRCTRVGQVIYIIEYVLLSNLAYTACVLYTV